VSDRLVRFPGTSWQEIEALPQALQWTVQRTIFHLLDEPVPTLADAFPSDDPLPGAYELLTRCRSACWLRMVIGGDSQLLVELATANALEEGIPLARREDQRRPVRVFGVTNSP
jgi:hypothetical protein